MRKAASNHTPSLAVLSLLLGAGMWGIVWYPMRLLEEAGLSGVWLTLIMYAAAFIVSLPRTALAYKDLRRSPVDMFIIAVAAGWTNTAFVLAVLDGNILRVLLLFYLSPLWAVLMGWLFLREQIARRHWWSLGVAMVGAMIMLWNPQVGLPWPEARADWLALSSGMAFAIANVFVRRADRASLAAKALSTWGGVVLVALALIGGAGLPMPEVSMHTVLAAALLGVAGILTMTLFVQYGVTHMPVHRSAVILLFEVLVGAVSQQLLTDEITGPKEWIGGALIIVAAYVSARR